VTALDGPGNSPAAPGCRSALRGLDRHAIDAGASMRDPGPMIQKYLRTFLFASRWLLAPMYIALVVCLMALMIKTGERVFEFARDFWSQSESATTLAVLGLIDLTLTGSLIVLVIFSGYENFIAAIDASERRNWPEWMGSIDFSGLKLKLMSSIVAISAIRLLEAFMEVGHETDRDLIWYVGIHMTFVMSGLLLALTDRFSAHETPSDAGGDKHR
jgi:uncharacterized protein (TIGR00645 family)